MRNYQGKPRQKIRNGRDLMHAENRKTIRAAFAADLAATDQDLADRTGLHYVTARRHRVEMFQGEMALNRDAKRFITESGLFEEFMSWRENGRKLKTPIFETDEQLSDFVLQPGLTCVR